VSHKYVSKIHERVPRQKGRRNVPEQ